MKPPQERSVLITGGTGSFGRAFIRRLLADDATPRRIVVFSRDEFKQSELARQIRHPAIRFFLGDVRDRDRLYRAFHDVDVVIHAAALKQVPAAEYNPFEAVKTNVLGAQNIIDAAIDAGVSRVVALSSDKAVNPVNLYGATKLCADKLFIAGNAYASGTPTRFSVVRYGNVLASRGSVVPLFRERAASGGKIPITDERMTRFFITLEQATAFVERCLGMMHGAEVFIPKIPSVKITDLAEAIAPGVEREVVGIRPGEKLHELLIGEDDGRRTIDLGDLFVLQPSHSFEASRLSLEGAAVPDGFRYGSDDNDAWLDVEEIRALLAPSG